jgi:hypothetical protein
LLEEGDIIEVPKSKLDHFNDNMTKMLGPLTGASTAVVSGSVVANPNSGGVYGGAR